LCSASEDVSSTALGTLKSLYDYTKDEEIQSGEAERFHSTTPTSKSKKTRKKLGISLTEAPLSQLITDSFDSEQVWEEVQLQNGLMYENLVSSISKLLAHANSLQSKAAEVIQTKNDANRHHLPQNTEALHSDEDGEDSEFEFEGRKKSSSKKFSKSYSKSIVDDKFFNLAQMTEFLEKVESQVENENKREGNPGNDASESDSDESIDMFEDIEEEDGVEDNGGDVGEHKNIYYNQFFDRPLDEEVLRQGLRPTQATEEDLDNCSLDMDEGEEESQGDNGAQEVHDSGLGKADFNLDPDEGSSTSEDETADNVADPTPASEVPTNLSTFEKRKKRIDESIQQMEEEAMQPKGWQYQGEVTAEKRPENSLLEEHLLFDHLLRQGKS